jgi:hypothetical protein
MLSTLLGARLSFWRMIRLGETGAMARHDHR